MSERILNALMQLFAIISRVEIVEEDGQTTVESKNGRKIVTAFLRSELNASSVNSYLKLFDDFLIQHHFGTRKKDGERKRTSVNSVKLLRICSQINKELTQRQKIIVILRILEFIRINKEINEQEIEFVNTVAESFNLDTTEFNHLSQHVNSRGKETLDFSDFLYVSPKQIETENALSLHLDGLDGVIRFIYLKSVNTLIFRYFGFDEINLNGQIIANDRNHLFQQGSSLRTTKSTPIYYSDIITQFLHTDKKQRILFEAQKVTFHFSKKKMGLHPFSLKEESGNLIGIMGGSGSGKSTFLNVLNGNYTPSSGKVLINGIDVHKEKEKLQGVIGYISQDDLLVEDLTVFQNLFFNTKLCFRDLNDKQIARKVLDLLNMIGLMEAMHLKVGSPLEKTISGGQRKRLNIALELIREPSILFVDEPTSGLSSRDSENIMDLLKELSSKGKLVFVVIHQPSSDIYKMFDRLLMLDKGGYLIFDGNPLDSIVYFKQCVNHVNANEPECPTCGNVNPEQLFNIVEARVVDEFGNHTSIRKTSPAEWYQQFKPNWKKEHLEISDSTPSGESKTPSKLKQFWVYFTRDVLSKKANKAYLLVTFLEAPLLALTLAFFLKFFQQTKSSSYVFYENENIPQYLFICVIVALFIGLTVTAEEIIKDRKMLKRESFLNLSRNSYLLSKIGLMFIISAIQTLTFVLIGNYILEIRGLWLEYWVVLFSTSCSANLMGLIISSAFKSEKVIYITVPILIIPQLLFSGVIVKFDKLHPYISNAIEVPFIGNSMLSRWSYEALVVTQATENKHQSKIYPFELEKSQFSWKRDYWIPVMEIHNKNLITSDVDTKTKKESKRILINEINRELTQWNNLSCENCQTLLQSNLSHKKQEELYEEISYFLSIIRNQATKRIDRATHKLDSIVLHKGANNFQIEKNQFENKNLTDLVRNRTEFDKIVTYKDELHQKEDPIYLIPYGKSFLDAHFYAPKKFFLGYEISTFHGNIGVIWLMSLFLYVILYFDLVRTGLAKLETIFRKSEE